MTLLSRLRRNITLEITAVFLLLLVFTSVVAAVAIRVLVRRDLEGGMRKDLLHAMEVLDSDLQKQRSEVFLFAQLASRAAQVLEQTADVGATTLQITLVEQSRLEGIEIQKFSSGESGTVEMGVLRRGFDGFPTVDYVLEGGGPGRLHQIAVVPLGQQGKERKVATASASLGREFLRREKERVGGDISLFLKGEFIASTSTCAKCMDCLKEVLFEEEQWRVLEKGKTLYFTYRCEPQPEAVLAIPVRTYDGKTVAIAISRSRLREITALNHTTAGVIGGCLLFTLAMGTAFYLLTSRAIRPLRELKRLAVGIAEGRYGETIPAEGENEVAGLANAFNRMSVSLRQAVQEISDWNILLENRVEEKTREIEKIHRRMVEVEKLAAMGQLAAGVAHEINNPLSGIMGYSEIALEMYGDKVRGNVTTDEIEKMIEYFRHIGALSQRCRTIILDMLKFARHHTEEDTELRLNDVIRETVVFLSKQLVRGRVKVVEELSGNLPPVIGNSLQLQQVFTNLILNAAQAMPDGGTLTIRTSWSDDNVRAEVADTGVGMDADTLHRIFEPFFTTKPVGEGTGLGLSVSYGIVKRHGGEIRVTSEQGKGSVFSVTLPRSSASR